MTSPVIKQEWVDALRSGEYAQDKGRLRTNEGFCCLGVLCDIQAKKGEIGDWEGEGDELWVEGWSCFLPPRVAEQAGVKRNDDRINTLISMNDKGIPFVEIADYIEENL